MPLTHALLVLLHVLAAVVWVGGMAAVHFAVRPAAVESLQPPLRLVFMNAMLSRFLNLVAIAIGVLLLSAGALIGLGNGLAALHWSSHAMAALGLVMVALYGHIRLAPARRLKAAVESAQWPAAAAALDSVRRLVTINLALGTLVFVLALVGPAA